jgi:hypothetical protein
MTACEGAVGAAGKPGDAGKDGVVGGDKLELKGDGYWYINGVKTEIKVEGLAELELTQAEGTTKKVNYLANDTLNLDGFGVKVNYTEYSRPVEDYILVWDDQISGQEKIIGRSGNAYKKIGNPDYPTIYTDNTNTTEKSYSRNFNTLATSEEGKQKIKVYGPAAEPTEFEISVLIFEFENIPSLARSTTPAIDNTGSFGDELTAIFKVKYADQIKNGDLLNLGEEENLTFTFYNNGKPYKFASGNIGITPSGTWQLTPSPNTSSERTYTVKISAYAGPGPYSIGVKALGFREARNLPSENQNSFNTTFNLSSGHSSGGITKFTKFMEQSDSSTSYTVNLTYTGATASYAGITDIRTGLLKGNPTAERPEGLRISLNLLGLPATVNETGNSAFEGCEALTILSIGKSVKTVGMRVFNQCPNLSEIIVERGVTANVIDDYATNDLLSEGGVLYKILDADEDPAWVAGGGNHGEGPIIVLEKALICWPAKKSLTSTGGEIVIDGLVSSVYGYAITHNTALRELNVIGMDNKITVAVDAVIYCPALNKVTLMQAGETEDAGPPATGVVYTNAFTWYGDLGSTIITTAVPLGRAGVFTGRAMANSDNCTIWSWAALP